MFMKKKFLCVVILMIFVLCVGCKKQEKSLTICVDSYYAEQARNLIEAWQHFNDSSTKVELVVIPQKQDEAEIKLTEIRTEIMSGGGPDIFILDTVNPHVVEEQVVLFDNVEKAMHSDIFLPLDEYFSGAQYMHTDAYNPVIFDSGKTEEGQCVLPIYYNYFLTAVTQADDEDPVEIPSSWDEVFKNSDKYIHNLNSFFMCRFYDLFGKYTDYNSGTLLYTEDDMLARVQEAIEYDNAYLEITFDENVYSGLPYNVLKDLEANKDAEHSLYVTPSVRGGITAYVTRYAAINRNTKHPEEAFSILDMLFSDQVMCDEGFIDDEKHYGNLLGLSYAGFSVPVHEGAFHKAYSLSDEDARALEDLNSQITAVSYYSNLDLDLLEMYNQCRYVTDVSEQKEIVSRIYNKMQMKLAE